MTIAKLWVSAGNPSQANDREVPKFNVPPPPAHVFASGNAAPSSSSPLVSTKSPLAPPPVPAPPVPAPPVPAPPVPDPPVAAPPLAVPPLAAPPLAVPHLPVPPLAVPPALVPPTPTVPPVAGEPPVPGVGVTVDEQPTTASGLVKARARRAWLRRMALFSVGGPGVGPTDQIAARWIRVHVDKAFSSQKQLPRACHEHGILVHRFHTDRHLRPVSRQRNANV